MYMKGINLQLPDELVEEIDSVRGYQPRTSWITEALRARLDRSQEIRAADAFAESTKARRKPDTSKIVVPPRPVVDAENTPHRKGRPNTPGHPLLDHGWVGIGQTCMRVGCEAPKDHAAHGQSDF